MSNIVQGDVWKTVSLPAAEMLLLVATADIVDDAGNGFWASDEYLSWKTGISTRMVQATKKKWRESGVLVPVGFFHLESKQSVFCDVNVRRGAGGRGWVVLYRLSLDPLVKKEPWRQGLAKKVAIAATFNDGLKVANLEPEGRNGVQQKVAMDAPEGRKRAQHNKEDPLVDPSVEPSATTTAIMPAEVTTILTQGLREILPDLDDRAIQEIWLKSRANAPDCTVEEVLFFAWAKAPALKRAENPAGLLITAVPACFEGQLLAEHRERQRQAEESRRQEQFSQQAEIEQFKADREREEHERAEGERRLGELPDGEREALRKRIVGRLNAEHPGFQQRCRPEEFERMVIREMGRALVRSARRFQMSGSPREEGRTAT